MQSSGMLHHMALVRTDVPPKRLFLQEPQGVTAQKMAFFIVTAVKTSDLTYQNTFCINFLIELLEQ
jgi:hypothetical protein